MNKPTTQLELVAAQKVDDPLPLVVAPRQDVVDDNDDDDFAWDSGDASIVVKPRPGIAVYGNKLGETVIRVQNVRDPDYGDHFAFVEPDALPAVISALKERLS